MIFSRTHRLMDEDPFEVIMSKHAHHLDLEKLEHILLKYKQMDRYRNTPSYLKYWLIFIHYQKTSFILPILCCLLDNRICDKRATLYEAIAHYQLKENKFREAEKTLLLGIKHKAEPKKRLEQVLHKFRVEKTIPFHLDQYTLNNHHDDHQVNRLESERSFKNQLEWISIQLENSIRVSVLRECQLMGEISIEELRASHLSLPVDTTNTTSDNTWTQLQKDLDDIFIAIQSKYVPVQQHVTPVVQIRQESLIQQEQHVTPFQIRQETPIPTISKENQVTQLPHTPGFIQIQLQSHGILERDDYHINNTSAQEIRPKSTITLGNDVYQVLNKLGQGGMAQIYLVANNNNNQTYFGLKVQQPPHPWEFYILCQLHKRRKMGKPQYYLHTLPVFGYYEYTDTSFLLMPHISDGTLLDVLNLYRQQHQAYMPEPIILLFTLQLLKEITALHDLHIIHNDLKLDNIMLTRKPNKSNLPVAFMIDYGRSIDLESIEFPMCKALWSTATPQSDYPHLNTLYHPIHADYWQLATMAHLLLFGSVMRYTKSKELYTIQQTIKRYWHKSLWTRFFQLMLNPPSSEEHRIAIVDLIQAFQEKSTHISKDEITEFYTVFDQGQKLS